MSCFKVDGVYVGSTPKKLTAQVLATPLGMSHKSTKISKNVFTHFEQLKILHQSLSIVKVYISLHKK